MSCIQQNFPSKFEPNDAFYEKLEENTFVAFILKHPVGQNLGSIGRRNSVILQLLQLKTNSA